MEKLMRVILATVAAMDAKGILNADEYRVPFSLHYHAGNDLWDKGWYASVSWNDDKESDIFATIEGAMEWVDEELNGILKEAGK